jgi:predicted alpha/beta-fold hydrolase
MDMRASGESKGKFCTLGIKESSDVYSMIIRLQELFDTKKIILYGRSMGAISIMKFISEEFKGTF